MEFSSKVFIDPTLDAIQQLLPLWLSFRVRDQLHECTNLFLFNFGFTSFVVVKLVDNPISFSLLLWCHHLPKLLEISPELRIAKDIMPKFVRDNVPNVFLLIDVCKVKNNLTCLHIVSGFKLQVWIGCIVYNNNSFRHFTEELGNFFFGCIKCILIPFSGYFGNGNFWLFILLNQVANYRSCKRRRNSISNNCFCKCFICW